MLLVAGVGVIACLTLLKQNSDANRVLLAKIAESDSQIKQLKGEGEKVQQQLTPEQKAKYVELGAGRWVKRLLNNALQA